MTTDEHHHLAGVPGGATGAAGEGACAEAGERPVMCEGCKQLADESRKRQASPGGANRHLNHLRKKKPHCEAPLTCTCQHRRIQDGYVPREET